MIIILQFIKINQYLQIFHQFSFLIKMVESVFIELILFLLYLLMVMSTFGLIFKLIFDQPASDSVGAGFFSYIIMSLRIVWGEGSFEIDKTEWKTLAWISYTMLMLVGNIILLNFLIAAVQQVYEKTTQNMRILRLKSHLYLINEYYQSLPDEEFLDPKRFPSTFALKDDPSDHGNVSQQSKRESLGIVNALKKHMEVANQDIRERQIMIKDKQERMFDTINRKMAEIEKANKEARLVMEENKIMIGRTVKLLKKHLGGQSADEDLILY
jgi:hypothetical protein